MFDYGSKSYEEGSHKFEGRCERIFLKASVYLKEITPVVIFDKNKIDEKGN